MLIVDCLSFHYPVQIINRQSTIQRVDTKRTNAMQASSTQRVPYPSLPVGGATLANQELIKDGATGAFVASDSLHDIKAAIGGSTPPIIGNHTITVAHGTTEQTITLFSPTKNLPFAIYVDVQSLVVAGEGGIVTLRLKLKIDNTNFRTIDIATFLVGTDEIHPEVEGFAEIGVSKMSLTIQCSQAVTMDRIIYYKVLGGI